MPNELGAPVCSHYSAHMLRIAALEVAKLAVEVVLDDVDTPFTFPGLDEVSFGQGRWIMNDTELHLRRRGASRTPVEVAVLESIRASRMASDYARRASSSGVSADRVRVWRAYEDAARWSRMARM